MVDLTITTDKGVKKIKLPETWGETTTEQYQNLTKGWDGKDLILAFTILSGLDRKLVANSYDPSLEAKLLVCTNFLYYEPDFKNASPPEYFEINSRKVKVPKNVGALSIGQNIHIRQELNNVKYLEELIGLTVAVYLQPAFDDSDFNFERAKDDLLPEVLKMPITKTYPVGFFLLNRLHIIGNSSRTGLSRYIHRLLSILSLNARLWPRQAG